MKTFKDLEFNPLPMDRGLAAKISFDNGYSVSVIQLKLYDSNTFFSYTNNDYEWEVAIFYDGDICCNPGIIDYVSGHLTEDDITEVMKNVQELPPGK